MVNGVFEKDQLKLFVERIERLEEEKKGLSDDIRDVYSEAKAAGFIPKHMKTCINLRKQNRDARLEDESILEAYKAALGLSFDDTPLGKSVADNDGENTGSDDQQPEPVKPKRTAKKTVRDPSDGSLVTVPTSGGVEGGNAPANNDTADAPAA